MGRKECALAFQSAPRNYFRGDTGMPEDAEPTELFQSAPRNYFRGDKWAKRPAVMRYRFQSAPRNYFRGDSGPANRHCRRVLPHAFRERRHSLRAFLVSNVKDQRQTIALAAFRGNRETLGSSPALGVRGSIVTR